MSPPLSSRFLVLFLIYYNPPKGLINLKGFITFLGLARVYFITRPLEFFNLDLSFLAIGKYLAGYLKGYFPLILRYKLSKSIVLSSSLLSLDSIGILESLGVIASRESL